MSERPTASLRLEPHMLPALAAAYDQAIEKMRTVVEDVTRRGRLPRPWTDDETALRVTEIYHQRVMGETDSAYAALRLYERELIAIRDTLRQMEADYRRTEGDNAALWGRL